MQVDLIKQLLREKQEAEEKLLREQREEEERLAAIQRAKEEEVILFYSLFYFICLFVIIIIIFEYNFTNCLNETVNEVFDCKNDLYLVVL